LCWPANERVHASGIAQSIYEADVIERLDDARSEMRADENFPSGLPCLAHVPQGAGAQLLRSAPYREISGGFGHDS
jgi:hypothetical protein